MQTTVKLETRWKDDYLDLLNYAKQIGDVEWQNEIIQTLTKSDSYIQQQTLEFQVSQLWQRFDAINTKMLELLSQIAAKLGVDASGDPSVAVLKQATRPESLVEQIDESIKEVEDGEGKAAVQRP